MDAFTVSQECFYTFMIMEDGKKDFVSTDVQLDFMETDQDISASVKVSHVTNLVSRFICRAG